MLAKRFHTTVMLFGVVTAVLLFYYLRQTGWEYSAAITASVTWLTALWWILEPIPIPVTSLIPIAVLPLSGVLSSKDVAAAYGSPLILLLLGGFILSQAMAKNNAHKRVAFHVIRFIGQDSERKLVLGFMLASALLSMWISNTATTLMLLPVAIAMISQAKNKAVAVPLLLAMAYGSSIGGMGTPVGTPPNLIFLQVYQDSFGVEVSFLQWMLWAVPVIIVFIPVAWLWLTRSLKGRDTSFQLSDLGPVSAAEKRVLWVFLFVILAWVLRSEPFGGWKTWLDLPNANNASVAFAGVVLMFLISDNKGGRLLDWEAASKIPWGILLLFAGGLTIAKAFVVSGLGVMVSVVIADNLPVSIMGIIVLLCLFTTFATEISTNTALTTLLMPILAAVAVELDVLPALIMVPVTLSATCAFMLPVATAPNAIVFGDPRIKIEDMIREGFVLNLVGVIIISVLSYFLVRGI